MGACLAKCRKAPAPPTNVVVKTSAEINKLIREQLRPTTHLALADRNFACVSKEEIEAFLSSDSTDGIKYKAEQFDCDDFAKVLAGEVSKWYGKADLTNAGIAFGIVHGDIRNDPASTEKRPHAVNFFVDVDSVIWLVEPQNNTISKLTDNSVIWYAWA